MIRSLRALLVDDSGATLVEYGLITGTLSIAGIAGMSLVIASCQTVLANTGTGFTDIANCPPGSIGC
jgi:Flp pilus assembly pilin Flp